MEDWTSLGLHKRHPEFPVVTRKSCYTSRKSTWFPRHRKMKPFPATVSQEKVIWHRARRSSRARCCKWTMSTEFCPARTGPVRTRDEESRQRGATSAASGG